ncbi:hypothetical protein CKY02_07950 [Photorhabdus bodei]|uniref:Uncharacterized protein n=1 Tax=Photorhabdus bodei TaxID=2029681 RepID=A0A329XCW6_9GAMM|nr:hypothetical protein CKY02_07950 [Photorhabdus bodei]
MIITHLNTLPVKRTNCINDTARLNPKSRVPRQAAKIRHNQKYSAIKYIPVIFQVASLLAALTHPGHIVIYAPGDSLPCRRNAS